MNPSGAQSRPGTPLWLLAMVSISGTIALHMFVPALPAAATALGASAAAMQTTITVYIFGLAAGQLIYGPLSDAFGRRPLLLIGLALYTVAGLAAALAPNVETLVWARLFQALGGCAGLALGRAIVRDVSQPDEAIRALALLTLTMMVGPGFAPLLGSGLVVVSGWRAVFVALALLGAATLILGWRLIPETNTHRSGRLHLRALARDHATLLRSPAFLGFAIGGGCATTSMYAYIAAAPFIFTDGLGRPLHEVGVYLALLVVGVSLGNVLTRRLSMNFDVGRLLGAATIASVASSIALLVVVLAGWLTVPLLVGLMFVFSIGTGIAGPAALGKALSIDARLVGSASGLYGSLQMSIGALCSALSGLGGNPALAAAIVMSAASLLALAAVRGALEWQRQR